MAINTWLLGGVMTNDHITAEISSCWTREDLVDIPAMIQYSDTFYPHLGAHIYSNNVGCSVILIPYGQFDSHDDMINDYYSGRYDSVYHQAYQTMLSALYAQTNRANAEVDWVMPVIEGTLKIEENYCYINNVNYENKQLVCLIDCGVIYSTVKMISSFTTKICEKKRLTKYEQYQLAYYQMILQAIDKPECFLTNKEEISIVRQIYDVWGITSTIENAIGNANQAVLLFSFLSNYQASQSTELFSSFLTFFGIVVGLEAIYNLLSALIGGATRWFNMIFVILIVVVFVVFFIHFSKKVKSKRKEDKEFQEKTTSIREIK